jgi:hypothetical protein
MRVDRETIGHNLPFAFMLRTQENGRPSTYPNINFTLAILLIEG